MTTITKTAVPPRFNTKFLATLAASLRLHKPKISDILSITIAKTEETFNGKKCDYRATIRAKNRLRGEFEISLLHWDICIWWPDPSSAASKKRR
ncbi:MAG: hypothetical protein FJY82_10530 [Candidatus Aminicenantes bacterium]|nr:hypothetical protein [Candidatus Aminicenantes bacterium]